MTQRTDELFERDPRVSQILDIFAKETATDRAALRPDARIDELGIASIDLTLAVFQLESVFDIEIPVMAATPGNEFATVGELVSMVVALLDNRAGEHEAAAHE
jgi:acyl carrier protein